MSYQPLSNDELAAVVTFLEMTDRPTLDVPASDLKLIRMERLSPAEYRDLFRLVGEQWLWFSRLIMDDVKLSAIITDADVQLFGVQSPSGDPVGMLELDFREERQCELAFVGLIPSLSGRGHGRWLLAEALRHAWRDGIRRVHVHTCSLDHPAALSAYRRAGFRAYKRAIERFPDPRQLGFLPKDCAPQVQLLGTLA